MSGIPPDDPDFKYLGVDRKKLVAEGGSFDSKKHILVPDEKRGFTKGEIQSTKGEEVTVKKESGEMVTIKKDQCREMNPPKYQMIEDMANMSFLNDAAVFSNLRDRYEATLIYTYSGLFCICINPYQWLTIYTDQIIGKYRGKRRNEMPPHLFATAEGAYQFMLQDRENQSILITGESGAGKTENTKKVIMYFAKVAAAQAKEGGEEVKKEEGKGSLEEQIMDTNPILEAYGNAKTVRNNNSSRFGKFIRIHFGTSGKIAGADIEHYLLEKARVVAQMSGERNYHIFYQMLSNAFPDYHEKLLVTPDAALYYNINQGVLVVDRMDDAEEFRLVDRSFDTLGFTTDEKWGVLKGTSACLNMGEMKFKQKPREEQAEADGTAESEKVAFLMGVNAADLLKCLLKPKVKVGGDYVTKGQNKEQVGFTVGAMAKSTYDRIFTWLVKRLNQTLEAQEKRQYYVGVLDIAGFEIFEFNSFEQLCINYTNERLQQFFNHNMFVLEQEEYTKEGIKWDTIDFGMDLEKCINLIEKPMGILSILEEECIVPKATDKTFQEKLYAQHLGKSPNFGKPKPKRGAKESHFDLFHYAGVVSYSVTGWLEKNKDPLSESVMEVLRESKDVLLASLYAAPAVEAGGGGGRKKKKGGGMQTISATHREQLLKLMHNLHSTHPHFVRCLIPNEKKQPGLLDAPLVLNQLQCNGVLEGIRICRKGFPNRVTFSEFKQRYSILAPNEVPEGFTDGKTVAAKILAAPHLGLDPNEYGIGTTKVFFRAGVLAKLEDLREDRLAKIFTLFQAWVRGYKMRHNYKTLQDQRTALELIQRNIRSYMAVKNWAWFQLYMKVKPLLNVARAEDDMKKKEEELEKNKNEVERLTKLMKEMEIQNVRLMDEKEKASLDAETGGDQLVEAEERIEQLIKDQQDYQAQLKELEERLVEEENNTEKVDLMKTKMEGEAGLLKKDIEDLEQGLAKATKDIANKDSQIATCRDEISKQDDVIGKLQKEKKGLEEVNRHTGEDLQAEEEKVNNLTKLKQKLELTLDELEENLEREKKTRAEVEKAKKKVEGDLRMTQEAVDDLERVRRELEENVRRRDMEINALNSKLEDEQGVVAQLNRKIKELQQRIEELEEELEAERQARAKVERQRSDLARELDELSERLDEQAGIATSQTEMVKKREQEVQKMRREAEEAALQHENQLQVLRKKQQDAVNDIADQVDQLNKVKQRMEGEKKQLQLEIDDLLNNLDHVERQKNQSEKLSKQLESQLTDMNSKIDEHSRQASELSSSKNRLLQENSDLARQVEEAEHQIGQLSKLKSQLSAQLESTKSSLEEESRTRQKLHSEVRNLQADCEQLREQLEEESEAKSELQRQLSKANNEIQQWRAKFESEGMSRTEELEEAKRRLAAKLSEAESQVEQSMAKVSQLEKTKQRMQGELEDLMIEVERANASSSSMEKRQRQYDKMVADWQSKCNELQTELENGQRECRTYSTEVFKLKAHNEEVHDGLEALKRENKNLQDEIHDLSSQMSEGGRNVHDIDKARKRLELEKEELQAALEEAEAALEQEEAKVMRATLELSQIRQEIDRRLAEKDEEFENTRRNHQRTLDSMQATLEAETKGKHDSLRIKKKLESDINELEIALDSANRQKGELDKNTKKYQLQLREMQGQIEEEARHRDETRELLSSQERRANLLQSEMEEVKTALEQAERARKMADGELHEAAERVADLAAQCAQNLGQKRKLEADVAALQSDLDDAQNELRNNDEKTKKSVADAARLAEELKQEQENSSHVDRMRRQLETQVKELQVRLEEADSIVAKGGKRHIQKLENRTRELESELDAEQRRHQETLKNARRADRRLKELSFQGDEDRKNQERMQDLVDKLQQKIKTYKRQVEEAEEIAAVNLAKYRKVQHELEDAEERADVAENSMAKLRAKNRGGTTTFSSTYTSGAAGSEAGGDE